jgi:putative ABC transport system permease protein
MPASIPPAGRSEPYERGVADADARHVVTGRVEAAPGDWVDLRVYAVDDYNDIRVNKIFPVSGAWPPGKKEILLERSDQDLVGKHVGDTLTMVMPNDKVVHLYIAGIAHDMIQVPAAFDGSPYGYIDMETMDYLGEASGYNELAVIPQPGLDKKGAQEVVSRVKDKLEKSGYSIMLSMAAEPGALPLEEILQAILLLLGLLGFLSLFLSIFLIINTISALVIQQTGQIGVMKAVGGRTSQIMMLYLSLVLCYGVIALIIAIPLGIVGARVLSDYMAQMFNFDLTGVAPPLLVIFIQIAIGLLGPCLAAIFPLITNLRGWAAEALSIYNRTAREQKANLMTRIAAYINGWLSKIIDARPILMSLRNTMRSKARLVMTLITLTLAGAIFICVFSVRYSLMATLEDMLKFYGFDVMISFPTDYRTEAIESQIMQLPDVRSVDVWLQFPARRVRPDGSETASIYLFAPRADSQLVQSPAIMAGRWLDPQDDYAVVINSYMARNETDIKLGDDIELKINGRKNRWRVVGISFGFGASMIYANYPAIAAEVGSVGRADTALIAGKYHSKADQLRLANQIETLLKRDGYRITTVTTIGQERSEMEMNFNMIIVLLLVMAMLLALVGGMGLMGTMSINVIERTREIGVLRAIGASNRSVAMVFMREGVLIGLMSWFLGIIASIPLTQVLCSLIGIAMLGMPLDAKFSLDGVWMWLLIVVVISLLASFLPARSASRLTVREVLAYE